MLLQIGNPLLDYINDFNSKDNYYWSNGLISDFVYELSKVCNRSTSFREYTEGSISPACAFVNTQVSNALIDYVDQYNVIGDVCLSSVQSQIDMLYHPIRSRFQTLSSLHSKSDTPSQQVKFAHCVKTMWCVIITHPFLCGDINLHFSPLFLHRKLRRRKMFVQMKTQTSI